MTQQLTILGSTGSIGVNTLDVVARHPDKYQIFALTGARQVDLMLQQCLAFKPLFAVIFEPHIVWVFFFDVAINNFCWPFCQRKFGCYRRGSTTGKPANCSHADFSAALITATLKWG